MVWRETECKTFGDYHDIYLKTDVLILADAFEAFRKASYPAFKLDPANYLTAPGLAWDACMKVIKVKLELFNEHQGDMHDFFTAMKRSRMSLARRCIARANISGLEGNLQQCIREGYIFEKIYRVLSFEQSPWMKPYIAMNTQRRAKAKNVFERDFWKLMNNSVFGKTMEDVRMRVNIDLRRLISDPAFVSRACILDLSKYFIETENIYQDMIDDCDLFDFSDYPEDHWVIKNLPEDQWIINEE
ncbi:2982_t:CDS:2, partial [Paraglomus occultum]